MKNFLLTIILISINLSVFSQTVLYNSNLIGQKLQLSDSSSEYKLKVVTEDNMVTTFLYLNDKQIKKVEINENGNNKSIITTENGETTTETYLNNLLLKIRKGNEVTSYTYDDGRLITKTNKKGGSFQTFSRYYYSGDELVTISRSRNGVMEYYVFKDEENPKLLLSKGNEFTEIDANNTILTSTSYEGSNRLSFNEASLNDDGTLIIKTLKASNIHNEYYDIDGMLYKEDVLDDEDNLIQTSTFEYDEFKNLSKSVEIQLGMNDSKNNTKKTSIYEGGKVQKILLEIDGALISTSLLDEFGKKVEILYKDGLKYCTITYDLDGKKILDIQYEKRQ
jgi:YD repeat-containing protein